MTQARKIMNLESGSLITEKTKNLYDRLVNSPAQTKEEAAIIYKSELDFLREKYNVSSNSDLVELADTNKVEIADASKILDYTSFLQRHQLQ